MCYFSLTAKKCPPWLYFIILQLGICIYFSIYKLLLTIANTLNIEEKLTAKNNPLGCIDTERGYSLNLWEINPFFS